MKKHKHKKEDKHILKQSEQSGQDVSDDTQSPQPVSSENPQTKLVDEWKEKYDDLFRQSQRLAADFQNYQKRTARQSEMTIQQTREDFARLLLPALDNFDHALEKGVEYSDVAAVLDGVKIVYDHLLGILNGAGLKKIEIQPGCPFDPSRHEALMQEESQVLPPQTIVRELACGYIMNERTLRPARVSVARAPIEPELTEKPSGDQAQIENSES